MIEASQQRLDCDGGVNRITYHSSCISGISEYQFCKDGDP